MPSGKPAGPRLYELPRRYRMGLALGIGVPLVALVLVLVMMVAFIEEGPLVVAVGVIMVLVIVGIVLYSWRSRSHITVYPDRVVVNGRSFRHGDVLWVDIYEVEEESSYTRVGRGDFMVGTSIISEMVFTVAGPERDEEFTVREVCSKLEAEALVRKLKRYLPNLRIQTHEGVEDRTLGPVWNVLDAMGGR